MHSGAWGIALIAIVAASWVLYRFLAPKTWREWAGAGVVQAFIIALYSEMYGFPLTIYLLARYFELDRGDLRANLWSTLIGLGPTGMLISMLLGYALVVGIGIIVQGWRELYRVRRENRFAADGLYGLVRHPQYTGLFIALFGEGVVHWPTLFSVGLFPVIVAVFFSLARSEEQRMLEQFGEEFRAYRQRVPMFVPRWGQWPRQAFECCGRQGLKRPESATRIRRDIIANINKTRDNAGARFGLNPKGRGALGAFRRRAPLQYSRLSVSWIMYLILNSPVR